MENQLSQLPKLLVKLETLMFTIEQIKKQFSQFTTETILKDYNELIQHFGIAQDTVKSLETHINKLEKIKVIARFYTKNIDNNVIVYYKINYPIQTCYDKIKEYYA
ncbi:plasmid maintenance protein [Borreliella yangtzensis]|uniref:Conjugal transfer/entry exclusion protein n=1 Tax=Borreliella yangtzensis TaxID=683292 RepID=A0ABR6PBG7_9SPIR|nr:conjugal transfer/entry exclusion protein [Borreliella yangtzensis]